MYNNIFAINIKHKDCIKIQKVKVRKNKTIILNTEP